MLAWHLEAHGSHGIWAQPLTRHGTHGAAGKTPISQTNPIEIHTLDMYFSTFWDFTVPWGISSCVGDFRRSLPVKGPDLLSHIYPLALVLIYWERDWILFSSIQATQMCEHIKTPWCLYLKKTGTEGSQLRYWHSQYVLMHSSLFWVMFCVVLSDWEGHSFSLNSFSFAFLYLHCTGFRWTIQNIFRQPGLWTIKWHGSQTITDQLAIKVSCLSY